MIFSEKAVDFTLLAGTSDPVRFPTSVTEVGRAEICKTKHLQRRFEFLMKSRNTAIALSTSLIVSCKI